ncbi:hypothetical protein [Enterococcus casseliflavus]|uniref:hypothetical protein n=1 Tax=Enterococcus casseliflavus TaxID=37734 RepID=UPI003A4C7B3E
MLAFILGAGTALIPWSAPFIIGALSFSAFLLSKVMRISTNTLAKLRKQGLKRVTIDGLCLYKKADIVEFLDEHKY